MTSARDAAQRTPLGRTALQVTRLGLGTAPLGGLYASLDDDSAVTTIRTAYDRGLRFFDTAPQYGHGLAERRLGQALRDVPRDDVVVATKVGRLLRKGVPLDKRYYHGTPDENPVFDFSYDGVMRSVEESLERMGLDRVDILHIHDPDDHFDEALADAYRALATLRAEGTIAAVGAGMNQSEMLARFAREGDFDCFLLAGRYTLLEQGALDELFGVCEDRGITIIAGGVFNSGILADPRSDAHFNYEPAPAEVVARALRLEAVCARHGVPLKAAALQFPALAPVVGAVLTGARTVDELEENLGLFAAPIPRALWDDLKGEGLIRDDAPTA